MLECTLRRRGDRALDIPIPWKLFAPRWKQGRYDVHDALSLALLSQLPYERRRRKGSTPAQDRAHRTALVERHGWFPDGYEEVRVRKGGDIDTLAVLGRRDGVLVVAFRGSASLADWIANLQAVRDPGPLDATKVHEGFQDAVHAAVMALTLRIVAMRRPEEAVWITGHSLGGAQAALLAGMLCENGVPVGGVYSYAAPRPGDKEYAAALNAALAGVAHYRVVNEGDLVPHLPPEPLYSHAGTVRVLRERDAKVETGAKSRSLWKRIRKRFIDWYDTLTDGQFVVKEIHVLADDKGYLPPLLAAAGYVLRDGRWQEAAG